MDSTYHAKKCVLAKQLRPVAYRSDLWRAMGVWDTGGLYLDHKMVLTLPLSDWANLTNPDEIVLPKDCVDAARCHGNVILKFVFNWNFLVLGFYQTIISDVTSCYISKLVINFN